ncbi:unnamed protein product [Brassica rapa subsp. narinosa]
MILPSAKFHVSSLSQQESYYKTQSFNDSTAPIRTVIFVRYRVELSVSNVTDDAVFVAFDIGMAKLTNIQAAEILVEGVYAKVDAELLRFVAEIFGKTYTFQLKIGEFNFPSKPQTFTIFCIFAERHQSPLPGFVIDVEVPDAHLPGVSALASNVAADENSNFSPQPSTSADPTVEM